ncbi:hypothetical protein E4665_00640 [Sporolactobacillus shoreae]|uniref:Uncharacterized protein n=1 Tax=Sporolactobacillus shoreae TaxID=1465501 RepID=A0A4Z0GUH7_9BACL|nr:hypothetical protein [Sporolactobacillus shoreae]TGB00217.1 hypothetical protein E4665_00640 [Sporolactobacillus shoreae]
MFGHRKIKKRLMKRKVLLENKLMHDMETAEDQGSVSDIASGELSAYDNHPADSATQLYEREKDLAFDKKERDELKDIQDALRKLENGTYGIDEKTGKKIPRARLNALPTARTAVNDAPPKHSYKVRPVEESVIDDLGGPDLFRDEDSGFDEQNAYELVSRYNDQKMIYENAPYQDYDERTGYVEDLEGFAATDIDGYTGDDQIQILKNRNFEHWRHNQEIDETDPVER